MAYLTLLELARVGLLRSDVLSALMKTMADFERVTGKKSFVPEDGGLRTLGRQAAIYADALANGYRAAPAEDSKHVYGAAFDLHIEGTGADPKLDAKNPLYTTLAQLGEANGLHAGLYFRSHATDKPDPYHFESPDSLATCQAKWAELTRGRLRRAAIGAGIAVGLSTLILIAARRVI